MMSSPQSKTGDYNAGSATDRIMPAECGGMRLDAALARLYPEYSRSRLQAWLRDGRIRIDGTAAEAKHKVCGGESIALAAEPAATSVDRPEAIALAIRFEDEHLLVIDKPAGLVVHPGNGNWSGTLMNALLHHEPRLAEVPRAGIVHRLDKDTSGLLVVAKTLIAQTHLVRQLQARSVRRHYLAVVHGSVTAGGTVDAPIGRHPVQRTRMAVVDSGREARTHYTVRERFAAATLIECRLETGRTHQIRVHMASLGFPLVGDPVYGKRKTADTLLATFSRQALHAWRLALIHPATGAELAWESPLPDDMTVLLADLRHA